MTQFLPANPTPSVDAFRIHPTTNQDGDPREVNSDVSTAMRNIYRTFKTNAKEVLNVLPVLASIHEKHLPHIHPIVQQHIHLPKENTSLLQHP